MAFDSHTNFAYSTVFTAPSPAVSGTSLIVLGGTWGTPPFNATVWPAGIAPTQSNAEIVRVTAITNGNTFTITRAQEGTSAQTIATGWQIANTLTAKTLTDIETAAISGTIAPATFTAAGTVKQREYNIKDYGATGNGATDDLTPIQSAINAAQTAGGGIVFIPQGTYIVSAIPTITGSNITVSGTGEGSKILLASSALNTAGTTIGIWVNGGSNIVIENLCIDGNYANIAKDGTYQSASSLWSPVISKYGATSVKAYKQGPNGGIDATTYLKQRMPIRITNAENVTVQNCLIQNSVSAGILADSTSLNGCTDILVTNNRIKNTWDNGVYFHQGVQYATASNNQISDTTYNGVSAVYCDHILIANNDIRFAGPSDSDSGGIQINGSSNCNVTGNLIDGCQFYGIDLLSSQETNITGGAGGNSVWADSNVISANTITNCNANDYPSHNAPGINMFGASNTSLSNNTIAGCDFGISMGSHATNTSITGNTVTKNKQLGINVGNSADVLNTVIKSNIVSYNGSHGVFSYASARYENNSFIGNNGMGLSLASPPDNVSQKVDYIIGNTILDNTDSGILTNGGANSLALIERNTFGNSYGVLFNDGSVTYNSTTLQSASASFTSSDVGLPVFLINQGSGDTMTTTSIQSVTDSTHVVLVGAAQSTQTGLSFYIGRGPAFYTGSTSGANLTAAAGTFKSTDGGKMVTVMSTDSNPSILFVGTVNTYNSATNVTLSGSVGTYGSVQFFINRSAGQQARGINNYNGYPAINRDNTFIGIPEVLDNNGSQNVTTKPLNNIRDPLFAQDVVTKSYFDAHTYTNEMAQDAVGAMIIDSGSVDVTYNDAAGTLTLDVSNSPNLAGHDDQYYLDRSHHTGTQAESTITGLQADLDAKENVSNKGSAYGYASLDANGTIPRAQIPATIPNITVGTTAPSSPAVGDLWVDTN